MKNFNLYDSIYDWYKTGTIVPKENKTRVDLLLKEMLNEAVTKYMNENVDVEEDEKLYWDKTLEEYVEPIDIIDKAAFEMWESNWYPKKTRELESLVEGSEIEDILLDLRPLCECHIANIKRKLF